MHKTIEIESSDIRSCKTFLCIEYPEAPLYPDGSNTKKLLYSPNLQLQLVSLAIESWSKALVEQSSWLKTREWVLVWDVIRHSVENPLRCKLNSYPSKSCIFNFDIASNLYFHLCCGRHLVWEQIWILCKRYFVVFFVSLYKIWVEKFRVKEVCIS